MQQDLYHVNKADLLLLEKKRSRKVRGKEKRKGERKEDKKKEGERRWIRKEDFRKRLSIRKNVHT